MLEKEKENIRKKKSEKRTTVLEEERRVRGGARRNESISRGRQREGKRRRPRRKIECVIPGRRHPINLPQESIVSGAEMLPDAPNEFLDLFWGFNWIRRR